MIKKSLLLALSVLGIAASSESALIAYEGFDYPAGSLNGNGVTGDGWVAGWSSGSNYDVISDSLSMPNLPFEPTGGSIVGQNTANRNFDGIDFSVEGVYYVSFIVKRTGWGAADGGGENIDFHLRSGFTQVAAVGVTSGEAFHTYNIGTDKSAGDAATSNSYFLVTKIVTHATANDEIYLKAYSIADTVEVSETISWTIVGDTEDESLTVDKITLWAGADNDGDGLFQAAIDEIRVGTTWADVVPVQNQADLIAYEGFDYSAGSLNGQGASTDGWLGSWSSGANYDVIEDSLSMPNLPFATTGGSVVGQSTANRYFSGIDLSRDDVYYASFIMQRTGFGAPETGEYFNFYFRTTGFARAANAGIGSKEEFTSLIEGGSQAGFVDGATSEPYFLVTKVVAHSDGADEIYLKAYSINDTISLAEETSWTVSGTGTNSLLANMITLWAGSNEGFQGAMDEIRVGRTWASVVPSNITVPANIVSVSPFGENALELVVSTAQPELSYPQCISNLVGGVWADIEHSVDGNEPFVLTNLSYSSSLGSDKVIYVKSDEAARFFRVNTDGE
jgi:hypothetical protein